MEISLEQYNKMAERLTELEYLLAEQQWTPCSERLPDDVEIGEEYPTVIFCTDKATYAGFYEHYLDGKWWTEGDYTVDGVIAWKPLPKPWRGEQHEL